MLRSGARRDARRVISTMPSRSRTRPEFGLTGGLQTLDPDEIAHWTEHVEVGNAYVNRHITGAIVQRQPFGGWKHSSVGPGAKAGGPNDILRFSRFAPRSLDGRLDPPRARRRTTSRDCRPSRTCCAPGRSPRCSCARPRPPPTDERRVVEEAGRLTGAVVEIVDTRESDDALARRIGASGAQRLRVLGPVSDVLARACHAAGITVDDTAVTADVARRAPAVSARAGDLPHAAPPRAGRTF